MRDTAALIAPDHRLARAFLALTGLQDRRPAGRDARQLQGRAGSGRRRGRQRRSLMAGPGRETAGGMSTHEAAEAMSTVAEPPPWERERRGRATPGPAPGGADA